MEESKFNKSQIKQLSELFNSQEERIVKRVRKDIVDQAELTKRELRDEFNQKLSAVEYRILKKMDDLRLEVAERFSDTVYNRFDDHETRLYNLEIKFA